MAASCSETLHGSSLKLHLEDPDCGRLPDIRTIILSTASLVLWTVRPPASGGPFFLLNSFSSVHLPSFVYLINHVSVFIHPVSRGSLSFPFPPSLHHHLFSLGIASLIITIAIPIGNTRPPSLAHHPSPHLLSSLAIIIIPLSGPTPQIMHNPPLLAHSPWCPCRLSLAHTYHFRPSAYLARLLGFSSVLGS